PGPLGLALPLIVANSESNDNTPPDDVTTLAEVPPVVGRGEETAKKSISDQKLNPLVQHVYIQSGGDGKKGLVVQQDPKAGEFVPLNTDVTLIVSLGVTPGPSQDDSVIDREILQDVKELQEAQTVTQNQLKQTVTQDQLKEATATILAAIKDKETPSTVSGTGSSVTGRK